MAAKFVKLGAKADSFYDPTSKLKLTPRVIVKLEREHRKSRRVNKAIATGHLQYATEEEFENQNTNSTPTTDDNSTPTWIEELVFEEAKLKKLTNPKLIELCKHLGTELSDEDLEDLNKSDLIDEALELYEDSDEDDD